MECVFNTEEVMNKIRCKIIEEQHTTDELGFISSYHNKMVKKCLERDKIVIFGAGVYGEMFLSDLLMHKADNICCLCDNKQAGKTVLGYEVLTPSEALKEFPDATFVITPRHYENEILEQLDEIGVKVSNILILTMLETGLEIV
jgi:FlaA1/EpsC-like NDP-sugar epimerase